MRRAGAVVLAAAAVAGAALAQTAGGDEVTLRIEGVPSGKGAVVAALCGDPKGQFPGACGDYRAVAPASAGVTLLRFPGVKPGTYAIQAFHDENGNGRLDIPAEGFAYGNDVPWPPAFDKASVRIEGAAEIKVALQTVQAGPAMPRRLGSKGAPAPEGVTKVDVRERGLYGELYLPEATGRHPAIILIGGSEGGLDVVSMMAGSFAREGYAALALAYWAEEGLPQALENIPLEYFDTAVAWLKARPEVRPDALAAMGWSRGSEAALLLASRNPDVRAAAAVAPSGIVWDGIDFTDFTKSRPSWTVGGKPLPHLQPVQEAYRPSEPMTGMFQASLALADRRPETAIPVEQARGPILLISGGADALWPSKGMSDRIVARLAAKGFAHPVQHLTYPDAGHVVFVGAPDGPLARSWTRPDPAMGGTLEAGRAAWADNWPKTLAFFEAALKADR